MKTFLFILLACIVFFLLFVIYLNIPWSKNHWFRKAVYHFWGYGVETQELMFRSHKFTDLFRYRNPFPMELGISIRGVHLVQRKWHGFNLQREFYTLNMIKMVTINESFGRIARIKLMVEFSPSQNAYLDVGRYFSVVDARRFYEEYLNLKHQLYRVGR